jgi:CDP-glycerol glycerophosphotransferase
MIMDGANSDNDPQSRRNLCPPLLSFILPVYNAAEFLTQCLDAITQHALCEIEIIAVDGASTDGSADILNQRKQNEPRLSVIRQSERIGPGNARNMGAEQARGEYLWFVDADDTVVTECLTSIVDSLKVATPDVLLVGYQLEHSRRPVELGPVGALNKRVNATCFTLAEHPEVLSVSLASWNKIVRRDFFDSQKVAFSPRWPHEDVQVSCRLLLNASKLSILDETCYRYRKDRPGSSMVAGARDRHFNVFAVWEEVLAYARGLIAAEHPMAPAEVYRTLFERAIGHCSAQLDSGGWGIGRIGVGGYVARSDRREFFDRMHKLFVSFVPPGYARPPGFRGIKFELIRRGDYWRYAVLDPFNKLRNAAQTRRVARGRAGRY